MDKILVFNSGSTSLKYALVADEKIILSGKQDNVTDHKSALKRALKEISDLQDIKFIGHRIVHGGDKFNQTTKIDQYVINDLEKLNELAPLHNPFSLEVIKEISDYFPDAIQYGVFDTAFFHNLPEIAITYALPIKIQKNYKIRKYGFHGISHNYSLIEASRELGSNSLKTNLIICHLGGGSSITAIKQGKPIETSMGFTPMEGLIMSTRCGDIDPGIIFYLFNSMPGFITGDKVMQVYDLLNNESGLKGLTDGIDDFKEILREYSLGNQNVKLAFDIYINKIVKYIGSYWFLLEGRVDAIVFTGSIGSGNPLTRNSIISKLKFLGDVKSLSIESNEEIMIAREIYQHN